MDIIWWTSCVKPIHYSSEFISVTTKNESEEFKGTLMMKENFSVLISFFLKKTLTCIFDI